MAVSRMNTNGTRRYASCRLALDSDIDSGFVMLIRARVGVVGCIVGLLVATCLYVPAAGAKATHHMKLKGVVVGFKLIAHEGRYARISVRRGSTKAGTMTVGPQNCLPTGGLCTQSGHANLKVGNVRGKAEVTVSFRATGCGEEGCSHPAKVGTGTIDTKTKSEGIRVNGKDIPETKGAKFTLVLSY